MHGGDIYRNSVQYDFSVNVNPLGMPPKMREAILAASEHLDEYPDPEADALRRAIGGRLGVPAEEIIPGNGASEIFMAAVHALRPDRVLLAAPSFSGYEYAVRSAGNVQIRYYETREENAFALDEGWLRDAADLAGAEAPMAFLACPNNPNGSMIPPAFLRKILETCEEFGIFLVLDECFLDFSEKIRDYRRLLAEWNGPHLIRTGAYTKICSIPGVRLGFAAVRDRDVRERIFRQLPEWNMSAFAQAAGAARYDEAAWLRRTWEHLAAERAYLQEVLCEDGIRSVIRFYPTEANYMLLYTPLPLYDEMLRRGILIRDCSDYPGLRKGFYRIAIRNRGENEVLAAALRELCRRDPVPAAHI